MAATTTGDEDAFLLAHTRASVSAAYLELLEEIKHRIASTSRMRDQTVTLGAHTAMTVRMETLHNVAALITQKHDAL